jgi:hypothetical protein
MAIRWMSYIVEVVTTIIHLKQQQMCIDKHLPGLMIAMRPNFKKKGGQLKDTLHAGSLTIRFSSMNL